MTESIENNDSLRKISSLLNLNFYIPSYQRGYRWTDKQVEDLLNDINDFDASDDKWYCLQPLVVKKCNEKDMYEVIDGQQRLTTVCLIIHYFNEMWIGKQKIKEPVIEYETRKYCYEYIKNLSIEDTDNNEYNVISTQPNDDNIDYYHIANAYKTIHKWVLDKINKGELDTNEFQSKFKEKTKMIWYETSKDIDGRNIFSRINMGKIPLTNSELIKALFLNSSNFQKYNKSSNVNDTDFLNERIRAKQLEIASEWDMIERELHDSEFWLFLNNNVDSDRDTRIEFIFELVSDYSVNNDDEYALFRKYYDRFSSLTEDEIMNEWQNIKKCYEVFRNWFEDRELYHKIGYLITIENNIKDLYEISKTKKKSEFLEYLNSKIKDEFSKINIDELEYTDGNIVRKLLLLHNIQTMLNNTKETSRFPFNRYKNEKWDIEHIHAVNSDLPQDIEDQVIWVKEHKNYIDAEEKDLLNKIDSFLENNQSEDFNIIANDIIDYFSEDEETNINDISNLVLLDQGTNRGYKNYAFVVKRQWIIDKEKEGTFVPICTKNVFMKYYSSNVKHMAMWGHKDREEYLENIRTTLADYLEEK